MSSSTFFPSVDGREAFDFVRAFESFELRSNELKMVTGKRAVMCAITSITGAFWRNLAALIDMGPELTYNYGGEDAADEGVFLDGSTALKGKHKQDYCDLHHAVRDIECNIRCGVLDYDVYVAYFPVYIAAGCMVEFGILDYRNDEYYESSRHDISTVEGRVSCFVAAINAFRLIRTLASCLPQRTTPGSK